MTSPDKPSVDLQIIGSGAANLIDARVVGAGTSVGAVPFSLRLRNISGASITLANPYEGTTYHLISAAGTPVQVVAPPSQAKVHSPVDPTARLAYLDLTGASIDGASSPPATFIAMSTIELPPDGEIVLDLAVRTAINPADRSTLEHVAAGAYQLVVMVQAAAESDGKRQPILLRTSDGLPVTAD